MIRISDKLFRGSYSTAWETIKTINSDQGYCVVSFLYFAQAMKFDLYKTQDKLTNYKTDIRTQYYHSLTKADLLLIDGIALQIFDRCGQFLFPPYTRKRSQNLNGTDFLPYILNATKHKKVAIILSSVYDPHIGKGPEWMQYGLDKLEHQFPHITTIFSYQSLYQDRGQNFPFQTLQNILETEHQNYDYILFLNGIGGPIQEIWTQEHRDFFQATGIIILNNGATIDYYSGFETRAPKRVVKLRIGETLWRIITQPKKNLHKFLSMFKIFPYRWYLITQYYLHIKHKK